MDYYRLQRNIISEENKINKIIEGDFGHGAKFEFVKIDGENSLVGFLSISNIPLNITPTENIYATDVFFNVFREISTDHQSKFCDVSGKSTKMCIGLSINERYLTFPALGNIELEDGCCLDLFASRKSHIKTYAEYIKCAMSGGDLSEFGWFLKSLLVRKSEIPVRIPDLIMPILRIQST